MVNTSGILGLTIVLILGIILIIGAILFVYKIVYNLSIKRRLAQGIVDGRQWPSPKNILLTTLIIILVIIIVISAIIATNNSTTDTQSNYYGSLSVYDSDDLSGTAMEIYKNAYNTGKLSGYTKEEKTKGDFHYICFKSDDEYDELHPAFVMFVEYTGSKEFEGYLEYATITDNSNSSRGKYNCGKISDYYFVAGNFDYDTMFCTYTLGLYSDYNIAKKAYNNLSFEKADKVFEITIDMD
jgi:uncharacterized protein YxeA